MSPFSDDPGAELREVFFESAQELLQSLNEEALKLERKPNDPEIVRTIRRIVHTLKGDAAACGLRELSDLAHQLEDALTSESVASRKDLVAVAFTAADTFEAMLAAYRSGTELPSSGPLQSMVHAIVAEPQSTQKRGKKTKSQAIPRPAWTEYEKLAMQNAWNQGKRVYHVAARIDPNCAMPIAACQLVSNGLAAVAETLISPEPEQAAKSKVLDFVVASTQTLESIAAKCRIPTVIAEVTVEAIKGRANSPQTSQPTPAASKPAEMASAPGTSADDEEESTPLPLSGRLTTENLLRVEASRIDNVLNLVGEMIIGKSMLQQALNELTREHPKDPVRTRFADAMGFQARVLNDLQRSVMKIRMVPVGQLFRRFPRLVHDVALQCGREVELVISGQDTDLDKSILDSLAEPLTHLARNAVGHGIEAPEERRRKGKPACGTLRLDAYHQGNQVVVEVRDDGRGIDSEKVKAKAVQQGLLSPDEAMQMTEAEALKLVYRPGFSTAEQITEVAGRGVGLDVVQSVLQRMKGTVDVETRPGMGTTFRLKLPLTLAIIKALLFRVEGRLYAIPLNAVAEIARAWESDLHQVEAYEVVQIRNGILPLVRLGRRHDAADGQKQSKIFVLVIHAGERKLGLIVDALEGEEELVIKALDDQTVATDLVSGASILGDGRVVLILNLAAVLERHSRARTEQDGGSTRGMLLSYGERMGRGMGVGQ